MQNFAKKDTSYNEQNITRKERSIMKRFTQKPTICLLCLLLVAVAVCSQSCKAWRTVTTTATYVQSNDSTKAQTTTTISTKTVEEYQGKKK